MPRALVERLAGGVVERAAEHARSGPWSSTRREQRVAAARRSGTGTAARTGPGARKFAATWPCRWSTGGQRQPARGGQPLGRRHAHEQRADQARARVTATSSTSSRPAPACVQGVVDDGVDQLEVVAGGDLGHDTAVAVVDALRGDDVGRGSRPPCDDDRGAGVVAARLEREDHAVCATPGTSLERAVPQRGGRAPHDHRVLAVVLVVAAAQAGGAEAEALVQGDRRRRWSAGPRA